MPIRRDSVVSILRLSDSHILAHASADEARQVVVIRHLAADFARLHRAFGAPDLVLITGDLAQAGEDEEYEEVNRSLIQTIMHAFGISKNRIYLVPGNHDANDKLANAYDNGLKIHDKHREDPLRGMDTLVGSRNRQGAEASEALWIFKKFDGYVGFCNKAFVHCAISASKPYFVHDWQPHRNAEYEVDPIRICGINTAYLSYRGDFKAKKWGNYSSPLALGSQQINEIVKGPDDMLRIVMMHHPPELLADGEQLMAELNKVPNLLFVGHMHQQRAEITDVVTDDGHLVFRAAATYLPIKEQDGRRRHGYDFLRVTVDGIEYYPRTHITGQANFRSGVEGEPKNSEDGGQEIGRRILIPRRVLPERFLAWLDKQVQQRVTPKIVRTTRRQTSVMAAVPGTMPPPPNLPVPRSEPEVEDVTQKEDLHLPVNPYAETVRDMPSPDALRKGELPDHTSERPVPPEEKVVPAVQTLPPPPLERATPERADCISAPDALSIATRPSHCPNADTNPTHPPDEPSRTNMASTKDLLRDLLRDAFPPEMPPPPRNVKRPFGIRATAATLGLLALIGFTWMRQTTQRHQPPPIASHASIKPELANPPASVIPKEVDKPAPPQSVSVVPNVQNAFALVADAQPNGHLYIMTCANNVDCQQKARGPIVRVDKHGSGERDVVFPGQAYALAATPTLLAWVERDGAIARVHTLDLNNGVQQDPVDREKGYSVEHDQPEMLSFGLAITPDNEIITSMNVPLQTTRTSNDGNQYYLDKPSGRAYLQSMLNAAPCGVAVGRDAAFFGAPNGDKRTIYHVPLAKGSTHGVLRGTQADEFKNPRGFAVYNEQLILVDEGATDNSGTLTIYPLTRDSKSGALVAGPSTHRIPDLGRPRCVAADQYGVAWTNQQDRSVSFMSWDTKRSTKKIDVPDTSAIPEMITLDSKYAFWTSSDGLVRKVERPDFAAP